MKSAVNNFSQHHIKCPCHPLGASRKEKARSEEADIITCTWYDMHEASRLISKPCIIFFVTGVIFCAPRLGQILAQ